jgi:hypothetical protein
MCKIRWGHLIFFQEPLFTILSKLSCIMHMLGQVNLTSRLSSRVFKKYGAGVRILFYNYHFTKEKLLNAILFSSTKGVTFYASNMLS